MTAVTQGQFASSTPATTANTVFAFFGAEGLTLTTTAASSWQQSFSKLGTASVGYGVSPVSIKIW